jgi:hypothetical protein
LKKELLFKLFMKIMHLHSFKQIISCNFRHAVVCNYQIHLDLLPK